MVSLLLCCCDDDDAIDQYPQPTHLFPNVVASCERTKKQQHSVLLFNNNRMLLAAQRNNASYLDGSIEDNHRALIAMTFLIQDQILQSMRSQVGYAEIKMESAIRNVEDSRVYEDKAKLPDLYHSRYSIRVLGMAKNCKSAGRDIMIHAAATLYLISMELLNMVKCVEEKDLEELFRVAKDHHRLMFLADPWKNEAEEFRKPTTEDCMSLLEKIEADLIKSAADMLDDVREDLVDALSRIYDFQPVSTKYKKLEEKRIRFSKFCIDTAAMLEIGAMYLVYMGSGRNAAFINCKVDVFGSEDQFLKEMCESECARCGNRLFVEDNISL